jgi:hypothetical protein
MAAIAVLEGIALIVLVSGRIDLGSASAHHPGQVASAAALGIRVAHVARGSGREAASRSATASRAYPSIPAMERAASYMQARAGNTAFAVVDTHGHEYGLNMHRTYVSASVTKAMLLVAYLRDLNGQHGQLGSTSQRLLYPMIHVSDNHAAEAVWDIVGNTGLRAVAAKAGMTDLTLGVDWANEQISAADQARFFYRINGLIPRRFRTYARSLLSGIDPTESWGIPAAARPTWRVYFKGGWRGTAQGQLVSQVGSLERGRSKIAIAVMTVTDPSMAYGEETIAGVAARLLGR